MNLSKLNYLPLALPFFSIYENKYFQYQWAMRHPVVNEAVTTALDNRFPHRS
jgi:hypothetical protein